ncbi:helicase, putative [Eimeria praecox]|uniref:Helicase, putative n=1 Tax=Eimeria praecox TaxID=51316 RepID=U6H4X5_9EIME|nr:helicase, putative [Eimeria praecox]
MKDTGQHLTAATLPPTCSAIPAAVAAEEDGTFGFPYIPYPSQLHFMAAVWRALQGSSQKTKFAALEMPTGGGKTLAFLCPSVLWLKQQEEQLLLQQKQQQMQMQQKQQQGPEQIKKTPAWVKTALLKQQHQQVQQFLRERSKRLKEAAARADAAAAAATSSNPGQQLEQQKNRECNVSVGSKRHAATNCMQEQQKHAEYDAFAPEEPGPSMDIEGARSRHEGWGISSQQGSFDRLRKPQIVICSRTHQQLQQYVGEIRRMQRQGRRDEIKDFVAVVAAGRQQLCIHPDVCDGISSNSGTNNSSSHLGDKCSYLVSKGLCSYYKKKHLVSDAAVTAPLDIEDLRSLGKSVGGCPYYGCRAAVAEADVVLLPFSLAFPADGDTAETGAVSLAGSVLCVDEAHHLSAALSSSKSAALSHQTAASASRLLSLYVKQFASRLAPRSLHLLQQLTRLAETIYKGLEPFCCCGKRQQSTRQQHQQYHAVEDPYANPYKSSAGSPASRTADTMGAAVGAAAVDKPVGDADTVLTATALLRLFKLDSFDLHELIDFLSDPSRRICQKLRGFAMHHNNKWQQPQQKQQQTEGLRMQEHDKHQHLKATRLVVLMGGTLSPFESFSRFVRCLPPSSSLFLSAGSGTAKGRVLAAPISRLSSSCSDFCFEFSQRMHFPAQFVSLLRLLLSVSDSVSGGVVVFFPSFAMLQSFLAVAGICGGGAGGDASAAAAPIVEALKRRGPIFAERQTPGPTKTDAGTHIAYGAALWQLYNCAVLGGGPQGGTWDAGSMKCARNLESVCERRPFRQDERPKAACTRVGVQKPKTAFLFCVMGGRLSEGVNFSNALARLLVVVGMPFPSIKDKIFILHKQHYNEIMVEHRTTEDEGKEAKPTPSCGSAVAKQLHQQQREQECVDYGLLQCMITVNQTIGRAIRHSKDYAAILLVDRRYSLARVQQLLPRWLLQNLDTAKLTEDEVRRAHHTVPTASCGTEDAGEDIKRRLQLFFGPLEKAELEVPKEQVTKHQR